MRFLVPILTILLAVCVSVGVQGEEPKSDPNVGAQVQARGLLSFEVDAEGDTVVRTRKGRSPIGSLSSPRAGDVVEAVRSTVDLVAKARTDAGAGDLGPVLLDLRAERKARWRWIESVLRAVLERPGAPQSVRLAAAPRERRSHDLRLAPAESADPRTVRIVFSLGQDASGVFTMVTVGDTSYGRPRDPTAGRDTFDWLDNARPDVVTPGGGASRPSLLHERFPVTRTESTTAMGAFLRLAVYGERPKESASLQKGIDRIAKLPPSWNTADGSIDLYYWYYGSLAMFQLGGDPWKKWDAALRDALGNQRLDLTPCEYRGSWDPIDPWGPDGGRVYATALGALCLLTPLRYERVSPK